MTLTTETGAEVRRLAGRAFEDILDGYFPLQESVRQMMERQGFNACWITLLHAPIMNIRHLAPTEPVPVTLPKIYAGIIDFMALTAVHADEGVSLSGVGEWFWVNPRDRAPTFPSSVRLGEPAFVQGIGLTGDAENPSAAVTGLNIAGLRIPSSSPLEDAITDATTQLGWSSSRAWGYGQSVSGIRQVGHVDMTRSVLGGSFSGGRMASATQPAPSPVEGWDYLLVDTSPDQPDAEALELALRLQ